MNKKVVVAVVLLVVLVAGFLTFLLLNKDSKKDEDKKIETVTQVKINNRDYIKSLEKISIEGTNDYVMVTENVKWEVPETEEGATVSFSIAIPYTITVDGKDYKGIYNLNESSSNISDENPKYNFEVVNLTKNGEIEILITNK